MVKLVRFFFALVLIIAFSGLAAQAQTPSVTYTYDADGRIKTATYDDGATLTYTYDAPGNFTALTAVLPQLTVSNVTYNYAKNLQAPLPAESITPVVTDSGSNAWTITSFTAPSHGTAALTASQQALTYTPTTLTGGMQDSFTYTVTDAVGVTATGTATINGPWLKPVVVAHSYNVTSYAATWTVLTGDSDPQGATLMVSSVTGALYGSAVINSGATVTYTPTAALAGKTDHLTYTVTNGQQSASNTISVTITPTAPILVTTALNISGFTLNFYTSSAGTDPLGLPLTFASATLGTFNSGSFVNHGTYITITQPNAPCDQTQVIFTLSNGYATSAAKGVLLSVPPQSGKTCIN